MAHLVVGAAAFGSQSLEFQRPFYTLGHVR